MSQSKIHITELFFILYFLAQLQLPEYFTPLTACLGFILIIALKFAFQGLHTRFAIFVYIQLVFLAFQHHKTTAPTDLNVPNPPSHPSVYFLAHGSPMLAIEQNHYTAFLRSLVQKKPKAVIIFTAHWETKITSISSVQGTYDLIYDFYGFPQELYEAKYPAKGSVELAGKVQKLLSDNSIKSQFDTKRGLDHGSWALLSKVFPQADVPVVQVSVCPDLSPRDQVNIGKALRGLDEDVMIIGSGVTVHNLRKLEWNIKSPVKWAVDFDDWLIENLKKNDTQSLLGYSVLAPRARDAVPTTEHFMPFFIALGAGDPKVVPEVMYRDYEYGTLSYVCFKFT